MSEVDPELSPLLAPLAALQRLLTRFGDRGAIIGGVAASLLGKPRLTADLDALIVIPDADLTALIDAAQAEGLTPRIPDAEAFARQHRVLLLRHAHSATNVDVALGMLPFEEELIERSVVHQVASVSLRLPTDGRAY